MRRMSGQRLAGILEWTPIFKRAHKRYKQAAGRSNHPPAHEMEFELWPREREAFVRVCRRASRRRRRRRCLIGHVCGRVSIDTSTKFANWKRRLIRWIRDFRFYDLIGVYKSTSCVCLCVCVCVWKREVWILWIEGLVVVRGRNFFPPLCGEKFIALNLIVMIWSSIGCCWNFARDRRCFFVRFIFYLRFEYMG